MKWTTYCKDRALAMAIYAAAFLFSVIFFIAFRIPSQPVIIILTIFFLAVLGCEIWNFCRKKAYYDNLIQTLEQMDQKYLIHEMLERPAFYDGKLLYDVLCQANRSMYEQVAHYRRETSAFQEYIELWVHEVKPPLATMQLMCRNDPNSKYAGQIRRMDACVENVLYYARSRNAEKDYLIQPVSLADAFREAAMKNREILLERGISLSTEHLDITVMTDGKWLCYIFGQLLSNSVKYISSERSPEIHVYAEDFADQTVLHFRDNGIGIPVKDLPLVFEKSFTGENGRAGTKSTGMGLYIVKSLCNKLGHAIEVQSLQGAYTEMILTFGKHDYYRMQQTPDRGNVTKL